MVRVGFGYDVHRLVVGRKLILGGVEIPFDKGLEGHSDADVLLHAITDSLLGGAGLGDIGSHFPDTDRKWKDADSAELLQQVVELVHSKSFRIGNIDSTVLIEKPRLRRHIETIQQSIAAILSIEIDLVSVKATTSEGMGFVGIGEGVAAFAVCTLVGD